MKTEHIPRGLVLMDIGQTCDIDACWADASDWFRNAPDDPDAFLVWNLCAEHGANYLEAHDEST